MKIKKAIKILKYYQKWRRGAEIPMPNPKKLGVAIDLVVKQLEKHSVKSECLICHKEIEGRGYCSSYCANIDFEKEANRPVSADGSNGGIVFVRDILTI